MALMLSEYRHTVFILKAALNLFETSPKGIAQHHTVTVVVKYRALAAVTVERTHFASGMLAAVYVGYKFHYLTSSSLKYVLI
jgi:hypothetical protein